MLALRDRDRNLEALSRLLGAGGTSLSTSLQEEKRREIEHPMLEVLDLLEC